MLLCVDAFGREGRLDGKFVGLDRVTELGLSLAAVELDLHPEGDVWTDLHTGLISREVRVSGRIDLEISLTDRHVLREGICSSVISRCSGTTIIR